MGSENSSDVCLLCDLGNSYIKVALGTGPRPVVGGLEPLLAWSHQGATQPSTWWPLWRSLDTHHLRPERIAISSVAGSRVSESLSVAFQSEGYMDFQINPDAGLELKVRHPESVGPDRLYAARAAFDLLEGQPAIVVDAGTALTVDVVVPGALSQRGEFLGGAIAPGPAMLARALAEGGAQLHRIEPQPHHKALGKETREALAAGVVVGFEGAALQLVQSVAQEACLVEPAIVLTGGASDYLTRVLTDLGWRILFESNLVLAGLWQAAMDGEA